MYGADLLDCGVGGKPQASFFERPPATPKDKHVLRTEKLIDELDLSRVHRKVLKDGKYTEAEVDEAVAIYRMYLKLSLSYINLGVPSQIVDDVWHQHILDTRRYSADCYSIFGRFIHHDPCHFSGNEAEDAVIHERIRENNRRTAKLLKEEFGVTAYDMPPVKDSHCEWCGGK